MAVLPIRQFGDPVLRQRTPDITDVDGSLARLADDMIESMYEARGVGLAGPQIGVERRIFVYDVGEAPGVVINPVIVESDGEWVYEEGCLSIPGLAWDVTRPKVVRLTGIGIDGEDLDVEADELLARCFQHEVDHLDGVLVIDRLDPEQRREAKAILRQRALEGAGLGQDPAAGY